MSYQLFFSVGVLQNLFSFFSVDATVNIFVKYCFNWFVFCVEGLFLAEERNVIYVDEVGCLELLLAQLIPILKQNVVIDWQIYQEGTHVFEAGLGLENDLLVTAKKGKVVVIFIN